MAKANGEKIGQMKLKEEFFGRVRNAEAIATIVNGACRRRVAQQGRTGSPAIVWRNGQVTLLKPIEIERLIPRDKSNWIEDMRGSAKDDPVFDEIVRLGKEIRDAEQPPED